jgi:hypothetical protein
MTITVVPWLIRGRQSWTMAHRRPEAARSGQPRPTPIAATIFSKYGGRIGVWITPSPELPWRNNLIGTHWPVSSWTSTSILSNERVAGKCGPSNVWTRTKLPWDCDGDRLGAAVGDMASGVFIGCLLAESAAGKHDPSTHRREQNYADMVEQLTLYFFFSGTSAKEGAGLATSGRLIDSSKIQCSFYITLSAYVACLWGLS